MALTVLTPNNFCFANNPIIVEARTDQSVGASGKSFLRIVCTATFTDYHGNEPDFSIELSQPVADRGSAKFNLSDAAQTLIKRIHSGLDMASSISRDIRIDCTFTCKEVWLFEGQEITGSAFPSEEEEKAGVNHLSIVPGGFTDYELMTRDTIALDSAVKEGGYLARLASRKPEGAILYKGEVLIVPFLSSLDVAEEVYMDAGAIRSTRAASASKNTLSYVAFNTEDLLSPDSYKVYTNSNFLATFQGPFRTNTHGVHFLRFINGFGAVENISVRSKDKLSYEVSGETHSLVQGAVTRPTDRRYATKSQPVGVYELSSGYVPKKWAEWFVQELLTSPRVWIQLGGKWVPALIEAEDDCVIYDRTKPEMPHVDFTLRLAIDGVTGITW